MSEKDIKLGGAASKKFAVSASAYSGRDSDVYQTSEQVREFYYQQQKQQDEAVERTTTSSVLPEGWEERQRNREVEAKQHGVFASTTAHIPDVVNVEPTKDTAERDVIPPEVAVLRMTTYSLETLAQTLAANNTKLPHEDRAAFAVAMKRAMDALAKSA